MDFAKSRAVWLVCLLAAEGLCLGVSFDSAALERFGPGWWSPLVHIAGRSMPVAATVFAALALVLAADSRRSGERPLWKLPHRPWPFVGLELVAFACAWWLGSKLFRIDGSLDAPSARFAGWLAAVAATLGAWLAALVPPRALLELARRRAGWLVAALVLGTLAFAAGRSAQELWMPLRRATFVAAQASLALFEPTVRAEPETLTLGAGNFAVIIAPECSGYEGLGLAAVFTLAALVLFRDVWRFPRAWLLVPLAMLAAWVANVVRLVALISIGAHVSPAIALGGFHSYAGTLLFCAASLSSVALGLRS
ncbi:MAG: archaeosortase/exosortase family protein, partial [Planctomycetes bacterium]|nr:archaeosortase/exosortase family protein [Planctomycetota bacterium]